MISVMHRCIHSKGRGLHNIIDWFYRMIFVAVRYSYEKHDCQRFFLLIQGDGLNFISVDMLHSAACIPYFTLSIPSLSPSHVYGAFSCVVNFPLLLSLLQIQNTHTSPLHSYLLPTTTHHILNRKRKSMHLPLPRRNPRHHLLLRNQMIDPLQQPQQALHTPTPLIQHVIRIPRLRETDHPRRPVNLGIYRFRGNELADVRLRFFLVEVQQLRQARHLDAGVVFRDDADVMFNNAFAEIEPALVAFLIEG